MSGPLTPEEKKLQARKVARTRRSQERKIRAALEPYLPELRKRWAEVAETGSSERACILCEEAGVGKCYACPVFGEALTGEGKGALDCADFVPTPPGCLEVTPQAVLLLSGWRNHKAKQSPLERAQEYGRKMVALLDSVAAGATTVALEAKPPQKWGAR